MGLSRAEELELLRLLEEDERDRIRGDFREFIKGAWPIIEPGREFIDGWHIYAIVDHLNALIDGELATNNLLINMPPRHMKSVLISVLWPAFLWLRVPNYRLMYASYAMTLSTRDSIMCRRLIESRWYKSLRPPFELASDNNVKSRFTNTKMGYRIATSIHGGGTGESADIFVADDPHNMINIDSPVIRQAVLDWFDGTMSTRGSDPKTYKKIVVMQRGHQKDLSGYVLAEKCDFEHLCLPAEYEAKDRKYTSLGWTDPRTKQGELLWPERFGPEEIAEMKKNLGSRKAAGQLQQRPASEEGAILKLKWFKFWRELPSRFDQLIQSWDMSFKDGEDNDYVVGQLWGKVGGDRYLIDQVRAIADFPDTIKLVRTFHAKWKHNITINNQAVTAILIEDKANGPAVISTLKKEISGIIPVTPDGSKISRVNAIAPTIEAGNVFLPDPSIAPWVNDFIVEATTFPAVEHDDQVDAMSQALNRFRSKASGDFSETLVPRSNTTIASKRDKSEW